MHKKASIVDLCGHHRLSIIKSMVALDVDTQEYLGVVFLINAFTIFVYKITIRRIALFPCLISWLFIES